eukprot:gene17880-biopygen4292
MPVSHPPRFGLIQSSPLVDGRRAGRRRRGCGTAMAKQVRDGAVKAKGKQRGEDCEGAEQRKAAGNLAENAGGAPALVLRAPEAPAES